MEGIIFMVQIKQKLINQTSIKKKCYIENTSKLFSKLFQVDPFES